MEKSIVNDNDSDNENQTDTTSSMNKESQRVYKHSSKKKRHC